MASLHGVPAELIFALDQYGQRLLAVGDHTRVKRGTKSISVLGSGDKRQITGVPLVSMAGIFVGQQAIWTGTTTRCHPKKVKVHPKLFHTHSANHWSTPATMSHIITSILCPYIDEVIAKMSLNAVQRQNQKSILLLDVWKHHLSLPFKELLASKKIIPVYLDPGTTSKEQVGDLVINRSMKAEVTSVISNSVAQKVSQQLKARRLLAAANVELPKISIDVKMGALKPLVVEGMINAIKFFESEEGKELIVKGFKKAGLDNCHKPEYIALAAAWAESAGFSDDVINPTFEASVDIPPNAGADDDDPFAVVIAEDVEESEDSQDSEDSGDVPW
jgi:hypothetical protein